MPSTSMPGPAAGLGSLLAARWPRCSLCIIGMTPRPGSVVCGRVAPAPTPASAAAANSSATARSPIANLAISAASLMTRRVSRGRQSRAAVRHTVMLRPKGARLVRAGNAMPTDRVVQYGIVRMASAAAVPNSGRRAPFPQRPCCPDNEGPDAAVCTNGLCGGCVRSSDGIPSCAGGILCCDTNCTGGVCLSQIGGPCAFDKDCEACDDNPDQCTDACVAGKCAVCACSVSREDSRVTGDRPDGRDYGIKGERSL